MSKIPTWLRTTATRMGLAAVALGVVLYVWHPRGFERFAWPLVFELPLLFALGSAFAYAQRPLPLKGVWIGAGVLLFYWFHDTCGRLLGRPPNWRDVSLLDELWEVLPTSQRAGLVVGVTVLATLVLGSLGWRRPRRMAAGAALAALLLIPWFAFGATATRVVNQFGTVESWSDEHNVRKHGRLFMTLVRHAEKDARREQLATVDLHEPAHTLGEHPPPSPGPNVYVIVLESFTDPRWLRALGSRDDLVAPGFAHLTAGDEVPSLITPAEAKGTARTEFELLCGTPSFGWLGGNEFGAFTRTAPCLPAVLRDAGYQTVAYHPFHAIMYNRAEAYPALGFERSHFLESPRNPDGMPLYVSDDYVHDEALFDWIFEDTQALREAGKPFLAYALTMYGHTPRRPAPGPAGSYPELEGVSEAADVAVILDQLRVRTQALADFIERLREVDPDAIVVAAGDHLPMLGVGDLSAYDQLDYRGPAGTPQLRETFLLARDGEQPFAHAGTRACELPFLVLQRLAMRENPGEFCSRGCSCGDPEQPRDETETRTYLKIHAAGMGF